MTSTGSDDFADFRQEYSLAVKLINYGESSEFLAGCGDNTNLTWMCNIILGEMSDPLVLYTHTHTHTLSLSLSLSPSISVSISVFPSVGPSPLFIIFIYLNRVSLLCSSLSASFVAHTSSLNLSISPYLSVNLLSFSLFFTLSCRISVYDFYFFPCLYLFPSICRSACLFFLCDFLTFPDSFS